MENDILEEAKGVAAKGLHRAASIKPQQPDAQRYAILQLDSKQVKLPIVMGSDGVEVLDIQALYAQGGVFCYDPGYTITGSCKSAIGNATSDGHLYYRGYSIEDLAEKSTFTEVCFILLYGRKPSETELQEFENRIKDEMYVHQKILDFYRGFSFEAHPMSIMCSVVAGLSSFIHNTLDIKDSL